MTKFDTTHDSPITCILSYSDEFGEYAVASRLDCAHIDEFIDNLLVPLLLSAGYTRELIESRLAQ